MSSGFILLLVLAMLAAGCSEERKREAARIAAELEAKERGETLPPEPVAVDSSQILAASQVSDSSSQLTTDSTPVSRDSVDQKAVLEMVKQLVEPVAPQVQVDTSKPSVTPTVTSSSMPPAITDGYTVQVESSPSKSYVEQQVQLFIDRGYDAYLGSVTKEDKTYYRLRVGKFTDRNEAVRVSAEINSMYNLQSWVDKGSW